MSRELQKSRAVVSHQLLEGIFQRTNTKTRNSFG